MNFVNPDALLIENTYTEAYKPYDGYDLNPLPTDVDSNLIESTDFKIGAGVYFDVDKGKEDDCSEKEEEKKKKKKKILKFLPFNVDEDIPNLKVDSDLLISVIEGGLYDYTPIEGDDIPGELNNDGSSFIAQVLEAPLKLKNDTKSDDYSGFTQFYKNSGDDCESSGVKFQPKLIITCILCIGLLTHIL